MTPSAPRFTCAGLPRFSRALSVTRGPEGLVRIGLKKAFADGTVAVDLDPLSLLSRLAASVPPPRFHTVRYAGVLGSASKLRSRIAPKRAEVSSPPVVEDIHDVPRRGPYRPWAALLLRTFDHRTHYSRHRAGDRAGSDHPPVPSGQRQGDRARRTASAVGGRSGLLPICRGA